MQISDLRNEVRARLLAFAWDQWTQMGVSGTPQRADRWAADPEALLLFTLEIARADARLFDEMLDWLALNERLVSVQRLRNLCRDDTDRTLAEAALAWVAQSTDSTRRSPRRPASESSPAVQLFRDPKADARPADKTFRAYGWLKPPTERSGKSRTPNLLAPINIAFRLRQILGHWRSCRGGQVPADGPSTKRYRAGRQFVRRVREAQRPRGPDCSSFSRGDRRGDSGK